VAATPAVLAKAGSLQLNDAVIARHEKVGETLGKGGAERERERERTREGDST
jgi:hypothetical protein